MSRARATRAGRSPGSRVIARRAPSQTFRAEAFPVQWLRPRCRVRMRVVLAAYSCRDSRGIARKRAHRVPVTGANESRIAELKSILDKLRHEANTVAVRRALGSDLTLRSNSTNLGILPTTTLDARLTNTTDLVVAGDFHIKALSAVLNLPDPLPNISFGPAYDSGPVSFDLVPIPLSQSTFDVDFGTSVGVPFNIGQDYIINAVSPGNRLIELVTGAVAGHQNLYTTGIYSLDQSQSECRLYVRFNPCRLQLFHDGAPVSVDANNEVTVLSGIDALSLPTITAAPVGSDAQELQTLLATGFSSHVPEPASWATMVAGFGVVGAVLRRRRADACTGTARRSRGAGPGD